MNKIALHWKILIGMGLGILFGFLIDIGFSIQQIAVVSGTYIFGSIILLYLVKNKLNPHYL